MKVRDDGWSSDSPAVDKLLTALDKYEMRTFIDNFYSFHDLACNGSTLPYKWAILESYPHDIEKNSKHRVKLWWLPR